jgi:hypothetical protein
MLHRFLLPLCAAGLIAIGGCTQTASPPPTPSIIGPTVAPPLRTAAGGGCAGDVAQYRAVMANVLATGHVNKSVHARVSGEIDRRPLPAPPGETRRRCACSTPPRLATATADRA